MTLKFNEGFAINPQSAKGGGGTLITKNITANGTYNASSDNADGYSSVAVNVPKGQIQDTLFFSYGLDYNSRNNGIQFVDANRIKMSAGSTNSFIRPRSGPIDLRDATTFRLRLGLYVPDSTTHAEWQTIWGVDYNSNAEALGRHGVIGLNIAYNTLNLNLVSNENNKVIGQLSTGNNYIELSYNNGSLTASYSTTGFDDMTILDQASSDVSGTARMCIGMNTTQYNQPLVLPQVLFDTIQVVKNGSVIWQPVA